MNKIKEINEIYEEDIRKDIGTQVENDYSLYDGYEVITEKEKLYILISNGQQCYENWGYFSTDDDLEKHIGEELLDIELTDTLLNTKSIKDFQEIEYADVNQVQFVTFKTNKDVFQLAVYNEHNGYYGHDIYIIRNKETLLENWL